MSKIAAIIVKYGEGTQVISDNIIVLLKLGVDIFLVDNSLNFDPSYGELNINYIHNYNNNGLAGGLNAGIKCAIKNGSEFLLLLDQDTILKIETLKEYFSESTRLLEDKKIACCGPSFIDIKFGKKHGFANYGFLKINAKPTHESAVSCLYLMTSATMISKDVFNVVGLMDESLFIDYIDVEWCLRARSRGYNILGLSEFEFLHNVGDSVKNILWLKVPVHNKFRLYYQTRNFIYLFRRGYIPFYWKVCELIYEFKRAFFYLIIDRKNLFVLLKGFQDGFKK
jgi:rhamnosyltransferase